MYLFLFLYPFFNIFFIQKSMQKCPPFINLFLFLFNFYMPKTSHLLLCFIYLYFLTMIDYCNPQISYRNALLSSITFHQFIFIYFSHGVHTCILYLISQELSSNEFIVCSSIFSTYVYNFKHEEVISIITFHI
jgi:hypothetical protein